MSSSRTPSLTPSRSPTPPLPVQPDHFYGSDVQFPPSPESDGRPWLDPADDPLAQRGIPVFKPTMDDFRDFERYMERIECWGRRSGIVKVIPPKEWHDALPPIDPMLADVQIKSPIEQHMIGRGGLFRQQNVERRKMMSVREWAELCAKDEFRAPGVDEVGLYGAHVPMPKTRPSRRAGKRGQSVKVEQEEVFIKEEPVDEPDHGAHSLLSPPNSAGAPSTPEATPAIAEEDAKPSSTSKKTPRVRDRQAEQDKRFAMDADFLKTFHPHADWLPPKTSSDSYTPEFCAKLERQYWRNLGMGKPAWYGADTAGTLFTDEVTSWNVAHLPSLLSRLLPSTSRGLPGVNEPYLYFGMWRATFAWHVEDMDLFSINYIHFGAGKHWYAIPQARAGALEQTMKGYFPKDISQCPQFLRHKSFLASPKLLAQSSVKPNTLVQHAGEFVITYPRGYHAGFNLGLNCAESVNFALDSWLQIARQAKACECVGDSVRIDIDELLQAREEEEAQAAAAAAATTTSTDTTASTAAATSPAKKYKSSPSKKRKSDVESQSPSKAKKPKVKTEPVEPAPPPPPPVKKLTVKLKLGPRPKEDVFPCCLCVSSATDGLLRVHEPPKHIRDAPGQTGPPMAHEACAMVVPETWVDELEVGPSGDDASAVKERLVFGVDVIPKDRWNLKCVACTKPRNKAHGAPIQCTKGKCPKAFHVACARDGLANGVVYNVVRQVEKEIILFGEPSAEPTPVPMAVDGVENVAPTAPASEPTGRVLKVIHKTEVQVLCLQHNPTTLEAKRNGKQARMRSHLVALAPMSRIKVRVSAGVFEVSLVRVIEEQGAVEVLWDKGYKREFKWSSVMFGDTPEGVTVGQMPTEMQSESFPTPALTSAPRVMGQEMLGTATPAGPSALRPAMATSSQLEALFSYQRQTGGALWPVNAQGTVQGYTYILPCAATLPTAVPHGTADAIHPVAYVPGPGVTLDAASAMHPQASDTSVARPIAPAPASAAVQSSASVLPVQYFAPPNAMPTPSSTSQSTSWSAAYIAAPSDSSTGHFDKYRKGQITWQHPYQSPSVRSVPSSSVPPRPASSTPAPDSAHDDATARSQSVPSTYQDGSTAPAFSKFPSAGSFAASYSQLASMASSYTPISTIANAEQAALQAIPPLPLSHPD